MSTFKSSTANVVPLAKQIARSVGFGLAIVFLVAPVLLILFYAVSTSFKQRLDIINPVFQWVFTPTLDNYKAVLDQDFIRFSVNSLVVASSSVAIGMIIGLPAAYTIARMRRTGLGSIILAVRVAPGIAFLVPYFVIFSRLGWLDSWRVLILTHLVITTPLITWLMISFFEDLPIELEEAAFVDGATRFAAFLRIILPLARGGAATVGLLAFIASWNNYLFAVVLTGRRAATIPAAAVRFIQYETINWGPLAAASVLMAIPVVLIALAMQRHLVSGLSMGAVKA